MSNREAPERVRARDKPTHPWRRPPQEIPHLTIANLDESKQPDRIELGFVNQHGAQPLVKAKAGEVFLIEKTSLTFPI